MFDSRGGAGIQYELQTMIWILALLVGLAMGYVVGYLFVGRKYSALQVERERLCAQYAMQQQRSSELQQELKAVQAAHAQLMEALQKARTEAAAHKIAWEKEQESAQGATARIDDLEQKLLNVRNDFTKALADVAAYKTALEKEQQHHAEVESKLREMQENHYAKFRNLAGEVMEQNAGKLKDTNRESLDKLLTPLREQIENLGKAVVATNETAAGNKASLEAAIKAMMDKTESLGRDAENLTLALRGNTKKQGDWGELILERLLEESGLRKGEEYYVQENHKTEDGRDVRPDVVVRFPQNRCVIIDSKVSLTAYVQYVAAESDDERKRYLAAHVASVRRHIDELAAKKYASVVKESISYVLMFMPNEAAYMAAVQADQALTIDAHRKKIVLISPSNLLMALQLAYNLWQKERQTQNVENIIYRATKLYEKMAGMQENMERVSRALKQADQAFSNAFKQFYLGKGCFCDQLEELRDMGITPNRQLKLDNDE